MDDVLHMSYMTGDIFGITAAMVLDPDLRVVFAYGDENEKEYVQNKRFYEACHLWNKVEKFNIRNIDDKATLKGFYTDFRGPKSSKAVKELCGKYPELKEVHVVTEMVAKKYESMGFKTAAEKVGAAWQLGAAPDDSLKELNQYTGSFVNKDEGQCVVLWSRLSGKNSGAHIELDSSFTGLRQLIQTLSTRPGQRKILLAGDDRDIEKVTSADGDRVAQTKLEQMALNDPSVHALGSFWKTEDYKRIWNGDSTLERIGQLLMWQQLAREKNVVHVGMRSGNLETFALLGMRVVYLENEGNKSGDRMTVFKPAGIPYERLLIEHSPTRTGQIDLGNEAPSIVKVQEKNARRYRPHVREMVKNTNEALKQNLGPNAPQYRAKELGEGQFWMYKPKTMNPLWSNDPEEKVEIPGPLRRGMWDKVLEESKPTDAQKGFTDNDLRKISDLVEQRLNSDNLA